MKLYIWLMIGRLLKNSVITFAILVAGLIRSVSSVDGLLSVSVEDKLQRLSGYIAGAPGSKVSLAYAEWVFHNFSVANSEGPVTDISYYD